VPYLFAILKRLEDFLLNSRPTGHKGTRVRNGSQVDQGVARKAQQEPEGKMEETETAAAAEAPLHRSLDMFPLMESAKNSLTCMHVHEKSAS
jgi:hypothetical protein